MRSDWPFSNEAQKTGSREKYPASDPKLSFFVRSGNIPEKRDQSKSEKPKILQTQTEAKKREHSGTEILRNSNRTARNLLKESCGEPQGKFITESGWAQWVAKHSSILSAAHCASDNIQQEKCLQRHAEVLSLPVV